MAFEILCELLPDPPSLPYGQVPYLHGDLQPAQRGLLLQKFNGGQQQVLLASDAFGLGLDFQGVDVVLQVEFLAASIRQYVHRWAVMKDTQVNLHLQSVRDNTRMPGSLGCLLHC